MGKLSEEQRKWVDQFLTNTGASHVGLAAVRRVAPALNQPSADNGDVLDGSPLTEGFDTAELAGAQVRADSDAPNKSRFKVKVTRIPPVAPGGGTESEREDIWVELVTGNVIEEVSIYEMVNSKDFVNNEINDVQGVLDPTVPFTKRPKIKEMKVIYKGGRYVVVPMNLIQRAPRAQARRYQRHAEGKLIYPVDKRGNALFDTINTPNVILCADFLEHLLAERLAQNLKVIELGATFAKIIAMNSAALGGTPQGHPPVGSRTPYKPVFQGPRRGGTGGGGGGPGGSGIPTTGSGNSRTSGGSGGAGTNRTGGTSTPRNPANVGGDDMPHTSMRLDEPKGAGRPTGGGSRPIKPVGGGSGGSTPTTGGTSGNAKAPTGTPAKPTGASGSPPTSGDPTRGGSFKGGGAGSGGATPKGGARTTSKPQGGDGDPSKATGKNRDPIKTNKTTAGEGTAAKKISAKDSNDDGVKGDSTKSTGNVKPSGSGTVIRRRPAQPPGTTDTSKPTSTTPPPAEKNPPAPGSSPAPTPGQGAPKPATKTAPAGPASKTPPTPQSNPAQKLPTAKSNPPAKPSGTPPTNPAPAKAPTSDSAPPVPKGTPTRSVVRTMINNRLEKIPERASSAKKPSRQLTKDEQNEAKRVVGILEDVEGGNHNAIKTLNADRPHDLKAGYDGWWSVDLNPHGGKEGNIMRLIFRIDESHGGYIARIVQMH